jgi:AraC-like DNA-binding protein
MKHATELFSFERRAARSPVVEQAWLTQSEPEDFFISVAVPQWELVVTRQRDTAVVTVRGPETTATTAVIPQDAEFFGITFGLGTFMPAIPAAQLVDDSWTLAAATKKSFWLAGSRLELPTPDNVDVFIDRLESSGLLLHDPLVAAFLQGEAPALSVRTLQRRVVRATGLTAGAIRQIRRAERAAKLLARGIRPLEVAQLAGYADQSHLTRSLTRFIGRTPAQIVSSACGG